MALSPLRSKLGVIGRRKYCCPCINVYDTYILSAVRTPIGGFGGKLAPLSATELGGAALSAAIEKSRICREDLQELVIGCVFTCGLRQDVGRQIAYYSGLPNPVVSTTINKLCASGMKAIMLACEIITSQNQELLAVGGIESLSNVPFILRRKNRRIGHLCVPDVILHDGLLDFEEDIDVTAYAEITAKDYNISRQDQDNYSLCSYQKACEATKNGVFNEELVPVITKIKGCEEVVCEDEEIYRIDEEKLRSLEPEMGKGGTITPGNASSLSDGACMLILASGNYILKRNLYPLARIISYADGAVEPKQFTIAPSVAVPRALVKANLCVDQIDMWEINETFSLTAIVNTKLMRIDPRLVNIHGGCVSLGHPFGMSGARIITHLAHCLEQGQYGCATISHGGGGASAMIIEKL